MDSCEQLKQDNRYLQDQLDEERRRREDQLDCEEHERKVRMQARREEWAHSQCEAEDWPEAFSKAIPRIRREVREEEDARAKWDDWAPNDLFHDWEREVVTAQSIYGEVIAETEKQIEALRLAALEQVADRLQAVVGETATVQALRENDPSYLVNW